MEKFSRNQILVNRWRIDSFIKKKKRNKRKKKILKSSFVSIAKADISNG